MKIGDFSCELVRGGRVQTKRLSSSVQENMLRAGGGKAELMMAVPPAHIVVKGKREAI